MKILLLIGLMASSAWAMTCPTHFASYNNVFCYHDGQYFAHFQGRWWRWADNYQGLRVLNLPGTGPGSDPKNNRLVAESQLEPMEETPGLTADEVFPAVDCECKYGEGHPYALIVTTLTGHIRRTDITSANPLFDCLKAAKSLGCLRGIDFQEP